MEQFHTQHYTLFKRTKIDLEDCGILLGHLSQHELYEFILRDRRSSFLKLGSKSHACIDSQVLRAARMRILCISQCREKAPKSSGCSYQCFSHRQELGERQLLLLLR